MDLPPEAATTYEVKAFLVNLDSRKPVAESPPVRTIWSPPPRPQDIEVLVNGKKMPLTELKAGDIYIDVPAGKIEVEARWTNDIRDSGHYVVVATSAPKERVYATCRTGTSCPVPAKVPLVVDQEMSWQVRVMTTLGDKLADGKQVCLIGRA